jgi:redox-sensitive bicupin YhaK (pirin superfamily)
MMHEERPETPGTVCHGLQMFVNLRSDHKQAPPRAFHVQAEDIPEVTLGRGARLRLLAGSLLGAESPLTALHTPILLLDVHLAPGASAQVPVAAPTCFVMSIAGGGSVGPTAGAAPLEAHEAVGFVDDGGAVELAAGPRGLHLLLAAGTPIAEPVVFGGPFAMTTRADIGAAIERYRRGEMGRLEPSF